MSYGISYTSGSLIPSFCLSIKGRHDAPSLSLCSDGMKSDLALYVCFEIVLFLSAPFSGRLPYYYNTPSAFQEIITVRLPLYCSNRNALYKIFLEKGIQHHDRQNSHHGNCHTNTYRGHLGLGCRTSCCL